MRTDSQFFQAAPQFAAYAGAKAASRARPPGVMKVGAGLDGDAPGPSNRAAEDIDSVAPEMYLARLDKALADMVKNVRAIGNALGDPRLASDSADPALQSEREQLGQLYAVQLGRISVLQEFLERQRAERIRTDKNVANNSALDRGSTPGGGPGISMAELAAGAAAALDSGHVAQQLGQPMLSGLAGNDKQSVNDWTSRIARAVREHENMAAQTFYGLAQKCM
jgi:hypothetical protein